MARPPPEDPRRHVEQLLELVDVESRAAAARAREALDRLGPAGAERAGLSLLDLALVEVEPGAQGLALVTLARRARGERLPPTRIHPGDPVRLLGGEDGGPGLRGVVARKTAERIQVALGEAAFDLDDDAHYRLDLGQDEVTTARQRAALRRLADGKRPRATRLLQVSLGLARPSFADALAPADAAFVARLGLDPAQQEAVTRALLAEDVSLIHGPPGTGKTSTLVAAIRAAVARGERVLATAPSNLAVDNLVERLAAAGLEVVRLGHPARVLPEVLEHTLGAKLERHEDVRLARNLVKEALTARRQADRFTRRRPAPGEKAALRAEARALLADARRLEARAEARVLDAAEVVCCTASVDPEALAGRRFDLVVVDEACQATEPGTWPPLLLGERALLAGDPLQLPPTVISPEADARGLAVSLFERLWARLGPVVTTRLVEQRRMHAAIMRYPSEALYDGALVAHPSVAAHRLLELPGVAASPLTDAPLALLDTAGAGWDDRPGDEGESRENPEEAALAARVVRRLLALGVAPRDVGVITPYAAQARRIRAALGEDAVEVDTVDGFQGREKEAIVVSLVRSGPEGALGFVADVRRMNVALTRARRKLVVIGDGAALAGHAFHAGLVEAFAAAGAHGTVWDLAGADLD